jgi:lauroyl/myristoyl acyltransferase
VRVGLRGYRTAAVAARMVPGPLAGLGARGIGAVLGVTSTDQRVIVTRHLRRADPSLSGWELERAADRAFDSYARYWLDSFRLPRLSARAVAAGFTADGYEHVPAALAAGKGVIVALPHLGGWEWAGRWLADRGHRPTVVVEPLDPPEVFEWFTALRRSLGMTVVPLGPGVATATLGALRRNEVVCLLADRDIGRGGVEVEFFGERTKLPAGPATLALRSGAPILATAVYFVDDGGHHTVVEPPLPTERRGSLREDTTRITQELAHALEGLIRRAPTQWHLFQPNWPSDPGYEG